MTYKPYPAYKDSGVEWLGKIPEGWEVWKVAHAFETSSGTTPPPGEEKWYGTAIPWITTGELREGKIWETEKYITEEALAAFSALKVVPVDSLLIAMYGATIGRLAKNMVSATMNQACCALTPKSVATTDFVFFYFQVAKDFLILLSSGGGQPNISQEKIRGFPIPLPPLPTQQAIAAFLDDKTSRIDGLIKDYEDLIALLREKRQALISHAVTRGLSELVPPDDPAFGQWAQPVKFVDSGVEWLGEIPEGWKISKMKYIAIAIIDCPHETPTYSTNGNYLVVRTADLFEGYIDNSEMYRIDQDEYENRIRRAPLNKSDIVYGREGERWGLAAVIPESGVFCLGQRMMQFKIKQENDPFYIMWQLNSPIAYEQGAIDTVGATSPHVNVETICNYLMVRPPKSEQEIVGSFLARETAKLDALVAEAEGAVDLLKERRSALITAAVTGKIDVEAAGAVK